MFINPMWDSETQRIGKQKCSPRAYHLHLVSDLVGFVALLLLPCVLVYLKFRDLDHSFDASLWWLLAIPFGVALCGTVLHSYSWILVARRGFRYDYQTGEASWLENGQRCVFVWDGIRDAHADGSR